MKKSKIRKPKEVLLFLIGMLFFCFPVIVADLYGGAGITNVYLLFVHILLFKIKKLSLAIRSIPKILLVYLIFILSVQTLFFGGNKYFLSGIFYITAALILAFYISENKEKRFYVFSKGLIVGLLISSIYFIVYASPDNYTDNNGGLRSCLKFFSISGAGIMASLGYYYGFSKLLKKVTIKDIIICIISVAVVFRAMSKNAIISMVIVSVLVLIFLKRLRLHPMTLFWFCVTLLLASFFLFDRISALDEMIVIDTEGSIKDGDVSINGRGYIWAICYQMVIDSPLIGKGYWGAVEYLAEATGGGLSDEGMQGTTQAHNMILHSLISVGLIGTTLLISYIISLWKKLKLLFKEQKNNPSFLWVCCYMIYLIFRGITEASIAQCGTIDIFFFLFLSLYINSIYIASKK